jgi:DNA-binding transcriptional MocR family regulator
MMKYIKMPVEAIFDLRLSANDMRVLAVLIFRSNPNPDNICWPSIRDLSFQTGISKKKISGHTKRLVNFGWIEKKSRGKGGVNNNQIYQVLTPPKSGVVKPPPTWYPNYPQLGTLTTTKVGESTPIIEIIKGNDKKKLENSSDNFSDFNSRERSVADDKKTRALLDRLLNMEKQQEHASV